MKNRIRVLSLAARVSISLAMLMLFAALPLAAQSVITPHDVARIRTVGDAVISPDGTQIAYVLSVPRNPMTEDDGGAWTELHMLGADGKSRAFITGAVNVSAVQWTPDGKGISFLARRAGDRGNSIYVIPADGGEARKVAGAETSISGYTFCPHMMHVAYLAQEAVPEAQRKLAERGFNQVVYEENLRPVRVWMAELDASGTAGKPHMVDLPGSASAITWNPVGEKIAVALAPTPLVDDDLMSRKIYVFSEEGKVLAQFNNPGKLGQFAWSPDGKYIAMISAADRNDPAAGRLMVVPAAGGALKELLPNYEGHVGAIAWQNNDTVMFIGDEGVATTFEKISLGGERKTIIPASGRILDRFTLSRDGLSAAFVAQSDHRPSDVFAMKHGEAQPKRLTDVNPWLAQKKLATQEVVKYKARDGLELEGMLIRPLDEVKGQRYPLILVVHGGPEARYANGWLTGYSNPGQVAAARGFAVFYPNYRGSTGRGLAFSKLSQSDPAGKEFDDYVDAVDHLIATGLVDKAKVGITGGSYGGYATAWGATYYSNRFAAGVMFVGISDKIAKFGTTDIPQEETLVHALHYPWDNWQKFLERSPIYHVQKSRTPLLILGGMDDPRVHPTQGMMLYRYLKTLNQAPVRWVRYPGEQHGNRRAASRLDYSLRMMEWMEHYLKGPGGAAPPPNLDYAEPK
ncbi:MAG: S9 family peptidase [Acidobacteria bacterium]|nr:S9 family peptidase [Acidobacteriota bacterium]MCL5286861.1 S9 family peptidase [Acidobacteriota bacterium]